MNLQKWEGIRPDVSLLYGGTPRPIIIFDAFIYFPHHPPWYRILGVKDYSLFRVHVAVDLAVFDDPQGKGSGYESMIGQDILYVLRTQGEERTRKSTEGAHALNKERREWSKRRPKMVLYDIKPNYRIEFGKAALLGGDLHDVRDWETQHQEIRQMLGLPPEEDAEEPE